MAKNTSIWLAGLSAAALISGAALAQTTPGQKMDEAGAHSGAAADQAGEALKDAASATGQAAENAAEATGEAAEDAANATGEAVEDAGKTVADAASDAATATTNAVKDGAEATADMADSAADSMTTPETASAEGTPVEGQIFEQSADTFLASTIMGADIINASGEDVGEVNDLVITDQGQVTGVVIGVGGFLGVGQKDVALEMSRVQTSTDEDGDLVFTINETEDALKNAPAFETAEDQERERDRTASAAQAPAAPAASQ